MDKYIISACLAGINCKYNGKSNYNPKITSLVKKSQAILVCPEQLGGLPTPRIPCENYNNKIISKDNQNFSIQFTKGAQEALKIAKLFGATKAILKSKSPSCGYKQIYDGTFTKTLTQKNGIFANLLEKENIPILTEKDFK